MKNFTRIIKTLSCTNDDIVAILKKISFLVKVQLKSALIVADLPCFPDTWWVSSSFVIVATSLFHKWLILAQKDKMQRLSSHQKMSTLSANRYLTRSDKSTLPVAVAHELILVHLQLRCVLKMRLFSARQRQQIFFAATVRATPILSQTILHRRYTSYPTFGHCTFCVF